MRIAAEKDYELQNSDSISPITEDLYEKLQYAVSACGRSRPLRIKIMFEVEG